VREGEENLSKYSGEEIKKIVVLGLGLSGLGAMELASKKGISVIGIDEGEKDLKPSDRNVELITNFRGDRLPESDLVVISPGIASNSRVGRLAEASKVPVIGELEFASNFAKVPILGITGTNGKTTVTEMTTLLLPGSISSGNIGYPLSRAVEENDAKSLVVEVSSFQLEKAPEFSPLTAAILNVSSDHINRYANFAEYQATKFKIFRNIANSADMIINYNLISEWEEWNSKQKNPRNGVPLTFSARDNCADIFSNKNTINMDILGIGEIDISGSQLCGEHNIENFMSSVLLASKIIANKKSLKDRIYYLLKNFKVSRHRQEVVEVRNGIEYVNDSKSTNPNAMSAALERFGTEKNICLIAGGLDKNMDFSEIIKYKKMIKNAFLIGESKKILQKSWMAHIECKICLSLEDALKKAEESASKGDTILLSPGCASMDMFANYKERGEIFCKIIHQTTT